MQHYDLIILGGGAGGFGAAIKANRDGLDCDHPAHPWATGLRVPHAHRSTSTGAIAGVVGRDWG